MLLNGREGIAFLDGPEIAHPLCRTVLVSIFVQVLAICFRKELKGPSGEGIPFMSFTVHVNAVDITADMKGKFDLIFCGKESLDGATGQMASQLAERFNASQISCCCGIEEVKDGKIRAARTLETGIELVEATLPCLITVEKDNFYGRLPNLKAYLDAKTAEITTYTENDIDGLDLQKIGVPGSGTIVPKIYPPELPEPGQIIRTGSVRTDVARLMELLAGKAAL